MILLFLAVTLTFQWDQTNCPAGNSLMQGTPVPANQPIAEVSLTVVKSNLPAGCTTQHTIGPGSYVFAMYGNPQSNRCSVIVYADNTWTTNCLAPKPPGPPPPKNVRFP